MEKDIIFDIDEMGVDALLSSESGIVVLDFWAPWCGPCKMLGQSLERYAQTCDRNDIKIARINIESEAQLQSRYAVRSTPTLIAMKGGIEIDRKVGAMMSNQLAQWMDNMRAA